MRPRDFTETKLESINVKVMAVVRNRPAAISLMGMYWIMDNMWDEVVVARG